MTKTIAFHTLGCKVNRYETDAVAKTFAENGYLVLGFDEKADMYVINTCTVTGEADRKSRQLLRQAKKRNPSAIVVAMGCHVELSDASSYADILIGNNEKSKVFEIVETFISNQIYLLNKTSESNRKDSSGILNLSNDISEVTQFEEMGMVTSQEETRAYIKIEDGCNNFCSYCAIPLARGRVRSRNEMAILNEAKGLSLEGFKEIVLTGIHVCSYGADRNESSDALIDLTFKLSLIPGIERIRFGSLEPQSLTKSFIEKASKIKSLCPHFHLSLQSGSDSILKRMNRKYSTNDYLNVVNMLKSSFKDSTITTDIITAFPGETQIEHEQTIEFCRKINFASIHVFKYSERKGTKAALMDKKVDAKTAIIRSNELLNLSQEMKEIICKNAVGKTYMILVEKIEDGFAFGYTENYLYSKIDLSKNNKKLEIKQGSIIKVIVKNYNTDYIECEINV